MIPIILIVVGVAISVKDSVSLSNNYELRKTHSRIVGFITITSGILAYFVSDKLVDPFSSNKLNVVYYISPVLGPLVALFLLNQKKLKGMEVSSTNKVANILTWMILFGVVAFAIWLLYTST